VIDLRHEEKTAVLRNLIFKTRNALQSGWSEEIYHQALAHSLQEANIPFISKPRRPFLHNGVEIHSFEPDLLVWDTIILELKALPYQKEFASEHYAQLIPYLKFWQKDLGLLVNFGPSRVIIKRVIWDEAELAITEDYDAIKPHLSEQDKPILRQIRQRVVNLAHQYGLGYPEIMYRKLTAVEMERHNLKCVSDIGVTPKWTGRNLPRHQTSYLRIADNYLTHIRALLPHPPAHDFQTMKNYLKHLGLQFGLLINFGQRELQIYGVKVD
jgi:GxxExxY protein